MDFVKLLREKENLSDPILEQYRIDKNLTSSELLTCDSLIKLLRLFGENDITLNKIILSTKSTELYSTLQEHIEDKRKNFMQVLYENHPVSNVIHKKERQFCYFEKQKIVFITKNLLNEYLLAFENKEYRIIKIVLNTVYDEKNNVINVPDETIRCIINNSVCYDFLRPILRKLFPKKFFIIKNIYNDGIDDLFVEIVIDNEIKTISFKFQNNNLIYGKHSFPLNYYQLSCLQHN